ncbi:MAG: alpha-L-fucosidase [Fimbriimonadaceae bacterium]|nr:alpha-L-fucosidase [Fimbriimonadaceae bacterium]
MLPALVCGLAMSGQAVPSARQSAWHGLGHYAFVHFGPNTFSGEEWGKGTEDPGSFAPTAMDTDQWCRAFRDAGMSMVVVTAKHHDGFCLWPSKLSRHTVAQSKWREGKGDVLRDLSRSCKKFGLKFGVYLSPWDRNHPAYGTPEYNDVFVGMLREVLTGYGEVSEVWFDGANGEGPNGKRQVYDWPRYIATVRELAPNACIFSDAGPDVRWAGNEAGTVSETNWSTIDNSKHSPGHADTALLQTGTRGGPDWIPAECDVSIRPGWFWRASENGRVKTLDQLIEIYLASVGRGANLILNVPPDTRGLIHENDVRALRQFGAWHRATFSRPARPGEVADILELREPIERGQRVSHFQAWLTSPVDAFPIMNPRISPVTGTTIGNRRLVRVTPLPVSKIEVTVVGDRKSHADVQAKMYASPQARAAAIESLVEADQAARRKLLDATSTGSTPDKSLQTAVEEADRASTAYMVEFLHEYGYPIRSLYGSRAEGNAWLLVQHADADPKFQARYLKAMEDALKEGEADPQHFAYLTDRVLRAQGKPQRFGTQCTILKGKASLQPTEAPERLDERRAKMGMEPIAAYLRMVETMYTQNEPMIQDAQAKDARMKWWREARFGLFIHWGLYAIPAGVWKGKDYPGASEWLINHADIPPQDWLPLAKQWNPEKFDARAWVRAAKAAGMKYIVITSKHHEGFALWPSKVSNFDVETTPNHTDILGELKKACDEEGIQFGLYHSILDWTHKDYLPKRGADKRPPGDFTAYVGYMKAQLYELVTRYDPAILWFDGEWDTTWTHDLGLELEQYLRGLKPNLIINNRIDKGRDGMAGMTEDGYGGDFGTPEQEIPARGFPGTDWESCMTMNGSWGFDANDANWKSPKTLVENLVDCASKGGNYLLNVGPTAAGEIPPESLERMATVGRWLNRYGDAVYGTSAGPLLKQVPWGRVTSKPGKLFVCVFDPVLEEVTLPGVKAKVTRIYPMAQREQPGSLMYSGGAEGLKIPVPISAADPLVRVIVVEHEGPVEVTPVLLRPGADGVLQVAADEWSVDGTARYEADKKCIGYWTSQLTTLRLEVEGLAKGIYSVEVEWACAPGNEGAEVEFAVGGSSVRAKVPSSGGWDRFETATLGTVSCEGGRTVLKVTPVTKPGGAVMNLRSLRLLPVPVGG